MSIDLQTKNLSRSANLRFPIVDRAERDRRDMSHTMLELRGVIYLVWDIINAGIELVKRSCPEGRVYSFSEQEGVSL
jgi:hypothetical protein